MNARNVFTFALALALASFTAVQAQTELPNQWVDQQMKSAPQSQGAASRAAATAPARTLPAAAKAVAPAGDSKQTAAAAATPTASTQK